MKPTQLQLCDLEARDVPASLPPMSDFNPVSGRLSIAIDNRDSTNQQYVRLGAVNGTVFMNSRVVTTPTGAPLKASDVRAITVAGSKFDNDIDVRGVTTQFFTGLNDRVNLVGGAGNDTINGRAFADRIRGGSGDDRLYGQDGNDQIFGEGGRDTLSGGRGSNRLDGGAGNDTFFGSNPGGSVYIGGDGIDTIFGFSNSRDRRGSGIEDIATRNS